MSVPRCLLPGASYLITRRCLCRQFLLRPSGVVNQLVLYCLAVAAKRFGIIIHSITVMSNHYHIVLTDPDACLPEFEGWLDAMVARALNARRGRWDPVWSPGSYNGVRLEDDDAIVGKCAYALANPVRAGLVREGHQWPGLRLGPGPKGELEVRRPHYFFREGGPLPPVATLRLREPRGFEPEAFAQQVREATAQLEEAARRKAAAEHRGFLGRRAVLAQSPTASPTSWEPRRVLRPQVACRDRSQRVELLQRLRAFLEGYREAWHRYAAGERDTIFPAGTYAMRVHLGVRCAPA